MRISDWSSDVCSSDLLLAGCIASGRGVLAAEALGADLAYIGSPFLAASEANTQPGFKQMLVDGDAKDVMVTSCFTGVNASFLRPSLVGNGLDPANLAPATQGEIGRAACRERVCPYV